MISHKEVRFDSSSRRCMQTIPPPPPPKRAFKPSHPPPPPPPPPKVATQKQDSIQKTPAKSPSALRGEGHQFSPYIVDEYEHEGNLHTKEVFVETPILSMLSPLSGITNMNPVETTLNSIGMLNFEYIENCSSKPDLQRIIGILSESKNKSPNLIKAAMERLSILRQNEIISPQKEHEFAQEAANLSRITTTNTTLDSFDPSKSTLNFSLSPTSTLHGVGLIETPHKPGFKIFENGKQYTNRRLGPIAESPTTLKEIRTCNNLAAGQLIDRSSPFHYRLRKELITLTSQNERNALNSDGKEQDTRVPPRIQSKGVLMGAQQVQFLENSLSEKSAVNEQLKIAFHKAREEHEETKKNLDITRATLFKKDKETRALEERLEIRIAELSKVLANTAERSKLVVEGERTYRKQCEEELLKENKKNSLLNQELKETRKNFEKLQQRHSSFRIELLKATGISKEGRLSLSQEEFVESLSKKIGMMKQDNDKMTQILNEAKKAIHERDGMEAQMNDAMQLNQKLANENQRLSIKVQELRAEVKSSRAYIDKLLRTSHMTEEKDWEKHEQQYKQVIQNLRKQIRRQDTVVSIDLYKAEKDKLREKVAKLRVAENTIDNLQAKVAGLQRQKGLIIGASQKPCEMNKKYVTEQNIQTPQNSTKHGCQKSKDDLTGITITFQKSPELNNSIRSRIMPPGSREVYERQTRTSDEPANEIRPNVLGEIPINCHGNTSHRNEGMELKNQVVHTFGNENSMTTRTKYRGSPSRLVRNFGGRSALKNKIKKMRSPKMSVSPMMPRQVQVILH